MYDQKYTILLINPDNTVDKYGMSEKNFNIAVHNNLFVASHGKEDFSFMPLYHHVPVVLRDQQIKNVRIVRDKNDRPISLEIYTA